MLTVRVPLTAWECPASSPCGRKRRVMIPGVAYFPNMEQPDLFNRLVLDFLGAVQPRGAGG